MYSSPHSKFAFKSDFNMQGITIYSNDMKTNAKSSRAFFIIPIKDEARIFNAHACIFDTQTRLVIRKRDMPFFSVIFACVRKEIVHDST